MPLSVSPKKELHCKEMVKVIDDALSADQFQKIQAAFLGDACPWFFSHGVTYQEDGHTQFVHGVYTSGEPTSNLWPLMRPLLQVLSAASVMSIKANLGVRTDTIVEHAMHNDNPLKDAYTAIYYINTNDGYSYFEQDERVGSVANRLVVFPSTMKHGGTSCTDQPCRVVINLNYHPMVHV